MTPWLAGEVRRWRTEDGTPVGGGWLCSLTKDFNESVWWFLLKDRLVVVDSRSYLPLRRYHRVWKWRSAHCFHLLADLSLDLRIVTQVQTFCFHLLIDRQALVEETGCNSHARILLFGLIPRGLWGSKGGINHDVIMLTAFRLQALLVLNRYWKTTL